MQIDFVLASLFIALGAIIIYLVDEAFPFTPRLAVWLGTLIGGEE